MVVEVCERDPCAYENERGDVEEEIDDGAEVGFLCLVVEEAVPSECSTTGKCGKEIIRPEKRADTDSEDGKGNVLGNVGMPVDEIFSFAKLHQVAEAEPEQSPDDNPHNYLVCNPREYSAMEEGARKRMKRVREREKLLTKPK